MPRQGFLHSDILILFTWNAENLLANNARIRTIRAALFYNPDDLIQGRSGCYQLISIFEFQNYFEVVELGQRRHFAFKDHFFRQLPPGFLRESRIELIPCLVRFRRGACCQEQNDDAQDRYVSFHFTLLCGIPFQFSQDDQCYMNPKLSSSNSFKKMSIWFKRTWAISCARGMVKRLRISSRRE